MDHKVPKPRMENTGNFYLDLINKVFNYMRQLLLTGKDRDPLLSDYNLCFIRLDNLNFNTEHSPNDRTIFISEDMSEDGGSRDAEIREIVEDKKIRIEIYLGSSKRSRDLTESKAKIQMDMRYLLNRPNFFGHIGEGRITDCRIMEYGPHPETMNTGEEVLVYLFEVRLHHFEKNFSHKDVSFNEQEEK